ncbi:MAG TPA: hypothetical protein ENK11_02345, partial [Phycisphaerales bacterium]|nr:hypothetical protein [Phycisphaerales bacterium]
MRTGTLALTILLTIPAVARGNDLVIGDTPGEVLVVDSLLTVDGSLVVINDGRVELGTNGVLRVTDEIQLAGDGTLIGAGGRIEFPQTYDYESQLLVWDRGTLDLSGTIIDGGGRSFSVAVGASVVFNNVEVVDGFATWAIFDGGDVALSDVVNTGEFLQLGPSSLSMTRCDFVLFWLTLPDGSVVDTALPPPGDVALFELNDQTPWASGIPYTTHIEDCTQTMWAVMARDGADSTIRDSQLRVVGSIFENDDAIEIVGLANGAVLADSTFQWGRVRHRFVNTSVQTWNLYAWQQTDLTIRTSVVGEIFSEDQAIVTVEQSVCDGTGGHIETSGQGQLFFLHSLCLTQLTSLDDSLVVAANSSFLSPTVDATDGAIIAFYNTPTFGDPRAHDAAVIFDVAIEPLEATRGDTVPIMGAARVIRGPESPIDFVSYGVAFSDGAGWSLIDGPVGDPTPDGVLAEWNTAAVAPGQYP